jgi:ABC-type multidrug transport system ATPase subunit/pSer/pThr/pTyr-binding forkhead associated (FHA) protein
MAPEPSGWPPAGEKTVLASQHTPLHVKTRRSDLTLDPSTEYRIGRDPNADIPLDDSRVSWNHAVLRVEGSTWVLEDRGSTNGTWIGSERQGRVEIRSVTVVRLGDAEEGPLVRLEPGQPPVQQAPPQQAPPQQAPQQGLGQHGLGQSAPSQGGYQPGQGGYQPGQGGYQPGQGGYQPGQGGYQPQPQQAPWAGQQGGLSPAASAALPSVDIRPTGRYKVQAQAIKIGRTPENDLVVNDLGVSRKHAELRRTPTGRYEIVDLGSHNGTYINGQRVDRKELTEDDLVSIGHSTFRLVGGELREFVDEGNVSFAAQDLKVVVDNGKVLLDVSFPIPEKCLMAVIGPSGAGKSTLLNALTGMRPADTGSVLYDNRDLYAHYAELRHRIGLVPQKDIVHLQLTARSALGYASELRFPSDTGKTERDERVTEVITELGLARHAEKKAENLSGGQLKRVSVAMELLTKPSLLFLDEPTSGLDPGMDKSVMEQMRDLAHDGRTVIVVTHSMENLDTCDRLLVLAPGGRISYYGPPDEGLAYFGKSRWADVFQGFERALDGEPGRDWGAEWAAQYKASPFYQKYVASQMVPPVPQGQHAGQLGGEPPLTPPRGRGRLTQVSTLSRRYAKVLASDRGFLLVSAILPIVLGGLVAGMPAKFGLAAATGDALRNGGNKDAITKLLVLVVCACLAGAANSVRELVKERPIYIRERAAGESSGAYLLSKILVLGVICVVQSVILFGIGLAPSFGKLPVTGSVLPPLLELLLAMIVLSIVSMTLGLVISALVPTNEIAMPILVGITMVQVVLSGGVFAVASTVGLAQVAWLAPSFWGMNALASTANLNVIQQTGTKPIGWWDHTASAWGSDIGALLALALVFVVISWWRLGKLSPGRRK